MVMGNGKLEVGNLKLARIFLRRRRVGRRNMLYQTEVGKVEDLN
jgi:hypothetical protein